jgi:sRNA-binding protein
MGYSRAEFREKINSVLDILVQKYPKSIFPKDSTDTAPLAIGIHQALINENPDIRPYWIVQFVRSYTQKDRYLRAVVTAPNRVNLDGSTSEEITVRHRERAVSQLAERQARRLAKEAA